MTTHLFDIPAPYAPPIVGSDHVFAMRRVFCVGRNYAAHAAEMGNEVDREAPFYFTKSPHCAVASRSVIPYPMASQDVHHEIELAVMIGRSGVQIPQAAAWEHVYGYAVALDMTRRDIQGRAKDKRRPWDLGKDFDHAMPIGAVTPKESAGDIMAQRITLDVNGGRRQDAPLADMVWSIPELISDLSHHYRLEAGDVILTGTPAGVGPVVEGDQLIGRIEGLSALEVSIGAPQTC